MYSFVHSCIECFSPKLNVYGRELDLYMYVVMSQLASYKSDLFCGMHFYISM